MPTINYGSLNPTLNNTNSYTSATARSGGGNTNIQPIRVLDIILDNSHPKFKEYGEWNSIGIIFYELATSPGSYIKTSAIPSFVAYPLFPNIKQYPLINELTYIIFLPGSNLTEDLNSSVAYYLPPTNIWNNQHHNAVPVTDTISPAQDRDYIQTELGSYRRVEDTSTEIYLGKTFKEKIDIHPLLPYEGDTIYEGRWGNSIRLGSTVKNAVIPNMWSNVGIGENGDPILILRNGQTTYNTNSWVPETEDINNDLSSIYLTSTQKLPLNISSLNDFSFSKSTPPIDPKQYAGNQIILNSGRLVFNAKSDSILVLANKSIQLSCNETLGVDAKQISLTADTVYLGSSEGDEGTRLQSVVLGENLNFVLSDIATFLQTLSIAFKTATDSNGAPIVSLQSIAFEADSLSNDITNIVNNKNLLSKQVKTV
jgi:hypothetical protein